MIPVLDDLPPCRRCGTCCRKGGPVLHHDDLERIGAPGGFAPGDLVTLRRGETVHDPMEDRLLRLGEEVVKMRGSGPGLSDCVFYSPEAGCLIHALRPLECRLLSCMDPEPLRRAYDKGRITRFDVLPEGHPLCDLIRAHEAACPFEEAQALALDPGSKGDSKRLAAMLRYDTEIRTRTQADPRLTEWGDFLFGRALPVALAPFGVRIREENGAFHVTINQKQRGSHQHEG